MRSTFCEAVARLSIGGATLMLLLNVVVVMYGISTRYLFGGAPIWTDELARYAMIATAMLGMSGVWLRGEHMRVSLAERFLSPRKARLIVLYQWLLGVIIALIGAWFCVRYALSVSMFRSQALGISRSIPIFSMPIGFALLALGLLLRGPKPIPQQIGDV
jgi:TRAP-type C4-dicarboxylate transport system permease small subunit